MAKRLLCVILSIMLVVAMMPVGVVAEDSVAKIGTTTYSTLAAAITAAGSTKTTITLTADTSENVTIKSKQNITLDLNGHTLSAADSTKAVITVGESIVSSSNAGNAAVFTLKDSSSGGTVTGGSYGVYLYGYMYGVTATIEDVTISDCTYGVYACTTFDLTMDGVTVKDNGSYGIYLNYNSAVAKATQSATLTDCTISGNSGSGIYCSGATLTINSSLITNNTAYSGAGISMGNGSTVTLNNTTVSYNTAENSGGGISLNSSDTLIMNSGSICYNTAEKSGGGVNLNSSCTFTMNGGSITGNTAGNSGGGVCLNSGCTFTMYDGSITENTAGNQGGAVLIGNTSEFEYNDGTISDNTAGNGDGVRKNSSESTFTTSEAVTHVLADTISAKAATCTEDGNVKYYTCSHCDKKFSDSGLTNEITDVTIPATGHSYSEPTWSWSEDYSTASATFTCDSDDDMQVVTAEVSTAVVDSTTTYTATVTFEGETYTDVSVVTSLADNWVEYANVSNGYDLAIGFYIPKSKLSNDGSYTVKITANVATYDNGWVKTPTVTTIDPSDWLEDSVSGTEYWVVEYCGIWAMQYADEITVDIYDSNGDKVCDSYTDSIADYEARYIEKYSSNTDAVALARALVAYCSAAETYYGY